MPLLFSYGTLQKEEVQRATFGRPLQGRVDVLVGFELSLVKIEDSQTPGRLRMRIKAKLMLQSARR